MLAISVRRAGIKSDHIQLDLSELYYKDTVRVAREEKKKKLNNGVLTDFVLDATGWSVIASLQSKLINRDIIATKNEDKRRRKGNWHGEWQAYVNGSFEETRTHEQGIPKYFNEYELSTNLENLCSCKTQAFLVLLELVAFRAYYPFNSEGSKSVKGLSLDNNTRKEFLNHTAQELGFSFSQVSDLDDAITSTINSITGRWWKMGAGVIAGLGLGALTMGIAAPFIGGLIGGAMGLSGAAATSAGLAALGGGALTAGGFGMAGGTFILVGGGALLGLGVGATSGSYISYMNEGSALIEAVKLEVFIKEFILSIQKDLDKANSMLESQRRTIERLENEIDQLREDEEENEKRINELEKVVSITKKALSRNKDVVKNWQTKHQMSEKENGS
jgi:hypothetical protein